HDINITSHIIKACLTTTDKVLHACIKILIYQVSLDKKKILHILQQEGDLVAAQLEIKKALSQLCTGLSTGQIKGYSQRLLY
ncbi:hypothetical protein BDW59DRAFT_143900, partial [Aspergillus cavernicola]